VIYAADVQVREGESLDDTAVTRGWPLVPQLSGAQGEAEALRYSPRRLRPAPNWESACLERDPEAFTPIAGAWPGIAPTVLVIWTPRPIISIYANASFGWVRVPLLRLPAIAFLIANDGSRGTRCTESENTDTQHKRAYKMSHSSTPFHWS
jgi:hypothetical protein